MNTALISQKIYSKTFLKQATQKKINKAKVLLTSGSLVQLKSFAECSTMLQYFWPALNDYHSWIHIVGPNLSDRLRKVLLYSSNK